MTSDLEGNAKFTEQEIIRINKLEELKKISMQPYPALEYKITAVIGDIIANFAQYENKTVAIAGRVMSKRLMGRVAFVEIQDLDNKIQLYIHLDSIKTNDNADIYNVFVKKLLDIGDFIGVEGFIFKTKVGETTLHVQDIKLLSKSLSPLPAVKDDGEKIHFAFNNAEQKYRQRYLDIILNKKSRDVFKKRTHIIRFMRNYLDNCGYYEVETPILQPIYGGATARPFTTHHNTLDQELYLRISNELYLKRLIIGGFEGVYEFAKDFRNEGMDRYHNPEFTQVELYVAYKDYKWMMSFVQDLLQHLAKHICGDLKIKKDDGEEIDFSTFETYTMSEIIREYTNIDIDTMSDDDLVSAAKKLNIDISSYASYGKIVDEIFGAQCEKKLIQPTFIIDYPIEMSPLAKQKHDNPKLVERFELFINGKECANAFSELNDPLEQKKRFEEELKNRLKGDPEAMQMDDDFIKALMYGMPPTAGVGIGIDRLTMLLTNAKSIQDVILFPQMKTV